MYEVLPAIRVGSGVWIMLCFSQAMVISDLWSKACKGEACAYLSFSNIRGVKPIASDKLSRQADNFIELDKLRGPQWEYPRES